MKQILITEEGLKRLLHIATGNIKDFILNEDGFLKDHLENCKGKYYE
jgi:hypothetical protein